MENPSTERRAFFSLYKRIEDMNHQCECVVPYKLSKEKLPRDTKFDNVRSYPQIRTPNKPHAGLDEINPFSGLSICRVVGPIQVIIYLMISFHMVVSPAVRNKFTM